MQARKTEWKCTFAFRERLGKTTNLTLYVLSRLTFSWRLSKHRFLRRWSTAIPMVGASFLEIPAACSSTRKSDDCIHSKYTSEKRYKTYPCKNSSLLVYNSISSTRPIDTPNTGHRMTTRKRCVSPRETYQHSNCTIVTLWLIVYIITLHRDKLWWYPLIIVVPNDENKTLTQKAQKDQENSGGTQTKLGPLKPLLLSGYLQLLQSEPTSSTDLRIVLQGLWMDDGPKGPCSGAGEHCHGLLLAHCKKQTDALLRFNPIVSITQ